jgi:hypothetical protein
MSVSAMIFLSSALRWNSGSDADHGRNELNRRIDQAIKAVKVDEKYLAETNAPMGVYRLGYYPHNVHFVMASAQMAGDGQTVIAAAEKLRELIPDEVARGIAMVQPVKAAPYFAHAQFSTPKTILALPDPGDAIPYVKAMWLYTRGVALARSRDFASAAAAADAIETLERTADFKLLKDSNVPAREVLRIARTLILARVAQAKGDMTTAHSGRFVSKEGLKEGTSIAFSPTHWMPRSKLVTEVRNARQGGTPNKRSRCTCIFCSGSVCSVSFH